MGSTFLSAHNLLNCLNVAVFIIVFVPFFIEDSFLGFFSENLFAKRCPSNSESLGLVKIFSLCL